MSNQPTPPTTTNYNRLPIVQSSKSRLSKQRSHNTEDEYSNSKVADLLNDKSKPSQIFRHKYVRSQHNVRKETYTPPHHQLNDYFKKNEQPRKCANLSMQDLPSARTNMTVIQFRPIQSPHGNKSSISDKDMTSGGKEVNKIMSASPKLDILGTSASGSLNADSITSKLSTTDRASIRMKESSPRRSKSSISPKYTAPNNKSNVVSSKYVLETNSSRSTSKLSPEQDIISETVEERIKSITNKYSPKHSSRIPLAEHGLSMNIEQKVSSIKEKYKRRREDILQGKGVAQIYSDVSEDSRVSKRNAPSNNSTYRRLSETNSHPKTIAENKISDDHIKQRVHPLPYGENGHQHSVGSGSNSRHDGYHLPQQHSGYPISSPYTRHDEHALSQYPYMQYGMPFPYPPNYPFPPYTFQPGYPAQERSQPNDHTETNLTSVEYNTRTTDINKSSPNVSTHLSDTESKTEADKSNDILSQDCEYKMKELERGHAISLKNISDISDKHSDVPIQEHKPSKLLKESVIETERLPSSEMEIQPTSSINMDTTIPNTISGDVEVSGSEKHLGSTKVSGKTPGSSNMSDKRSVPIVDKTPGSVKLPDKNSGPTASINPGATNISYKSSGQTADILGPAYMSDKSSVPTANSTTEAANCSDKSLGPTMDKNPGLTNLSDKFSAQTADKYPGLTADLCMGPADLLKKRSEERGLVDANAIYGADILQSNSSHLKIVGTVTETQAYIAENEPLTQDISLSNTLNERPQIATFENSDTDLLTSNSRLRFSEDINNDESSCSELNKSSLFAEEIEDSSVGIDSNTQSYLDLPDNCTDTDIDGDTDTESVRRDFYENTQKIKDLLEGPQNDFADVYRHKMSRNTTSSASSQG